MQGGDGFVTGNSVEFPWTSNTAVERPAASSCRERPRSAPGRATRSQVCSALEEAEDALRTGPSSPCGRDLGLCVCRRALPGLPGSALPAPPALPLPAQPDSQDSALGGSMVSSVELVGTAKGLQEERSDQ